MLRGARPSAKSRRWLRASVSANWSAGGGMASLIRTKSIDELIASSEDPERRLRKTLGPWSLTFLGSGAIIRSSIFTVTGTATIGKVEQIKSLLHATILDLVTHGAGAASTLGRPGAGPAITLSFVLVGVA